MPEISVPWDDNPLTISLPADWHVLPTAPSSLRVAPEDWADRLAASLAKPAAGPSLGQLLGGLQGGRVALIVEDHARHSPLSEILPLILREIRHAGVADEQIEIVLASGMHPPMTAEQVAAKVGPDAAGLRWRCNPWQTPSAYFHLAQVGRLEVLVDRGVLEADLRIVVTSVTPHLQAGFSGGYKMLFPGCAGLETIRGLHRMGLSRRHDQFVGADATRCPMRRAIDAAGAALDAAHGKTFSVQFLLDTADRPAYIASGEVVAAQTMLAKQAAIACGVVTDQVADVVIANAYPRDVDLWQCLKSVLNTLEAARPGGVMICLARCPQGLNGMNPPKRWPLDPAWTRRLVRLLHPDPLASLLTRLAPTLAGDAAFFVRLALQALYRNPILVVSPALCQAGVTFPGLPIFPTAADAIAAASALLEAGPQRVALFPAGGTTYPVPTLLVQP
ncbi:MAG: lactate racemase domain-containing protein [Planctomycetota bacterium]|nr:lactate racemase domain-containing protein [Planctomycetota bacterium]